MNLSAMLIIYELEKSAKKPKVAHNGITWLKNPLSGLQLYDPGTFRPEDCREDVLYIAEASDIGASALPACMFAAGLPETGRHDGVVYIDMTLVALVNTIGSLFYEYNKIEEALNAAVSRNEPLRNVLSIAARFFNNPITISDMRLRFVEMSDNVVRELMPDYFKVVLDTGYIDIRLIVAMRNKGYDKIINTYRDTMLIELEEIPARYFSKNIFDGGQLKASLVIHEVFSPIDASQSVIVDQITQLIDNYAYRSTRGKQATLTKAEQCISDLISGSPYNEDLHAMHLREIGWEVDDRFYLIKVETNPIHTATAPYTFAAAHSYFPGSLIVEREMDAVIVVCVKLAPFDMAARVSALEKYLTDRQDKAAVSRQFTDFRHIGEHYKIVSATLELGASLDPEKSLYDFRDYLLPVMLKICRSFVDLRVFCSYEAIRLKEHDAANEGDLFRSLYVYLKHNKSLAAASRELNIHRNTLLYRLGRAAEITGLDPGDDSIFLPIVLSYEILHYRLKLESMPGLEAMDENL